MHRLRSAATALLLASFVGLPAPAALAQGRDRRDRDRYEDRRDRNDDRRDRDEDRRDRRDERRDRYEDQRERQRDRWSRGDSRYDTGYGYWDPAPYYRRDDRRSRARPMGRNDRIYRGSDSRYYCRRDDGTTGLIIGGVGGGVLGSIIAPGGSRTLGAIIGAGAGAILGRALDRGDVVCR